MNFEKKQYHQDENRLFDNHMRSLEDWHVFYKQFIWHYSCTLRERQILFSRHSIILILGLMHQAQRSTGVQGFHLVLLGEARGAVDVNVSTIPSM